MRHHVMIPAVAAVGFVLALGTVLVYQPRWLLRLVATGSPDVLFYVDTDRRAVALTIDDGPDPRTTPGILDVLARHGARATFFLISGRVPGNEGLVARIVAEGHEVGNHLTRDEASIDLAPAAFVAALAESDSILRRFAPVRWFRPGSGWYNRVMVETARSLGLRTALGSVYPYDALIPWAGFAAFQVRLAVDPGDVIVLHDAGARGRRTAAALGRILPELRRRGFRIVRLSELIK